MYHFVRDHNPACEKLDPHTLKCVFVGYSRTQKGSKYYHPPFRKLFVSMDVTFFESQLYFLSSQPPLQGEIQDKMVSYEDENEEENECSLV